MDDLLEQITSRTGIARDQAGQVVDAVKDFLTSKLPGPIASQVDGLLSQGGSASGNMQQQAQQQMGNLGQMLHGDG